MRNERNLFTVFALLAFANSAAYIIFAELSIDLLGGQVSGTSLLMMKYYGAIALGSAVVIWLLRNSKDQKTVQAMVIGIFISMLLSTIFGVYGSWNQWFPNFDWLFILIDSTLTLWSGYLFLTKFSKN